MLFTKEFILTTLQQGNILSADIHMLVCRNSFVPNGRAHLDVDFETSNFIASLS